MDEVCTDRTATWSRAWSPTALLIPRACGALRASVRSTEVTDAARPNPIFLSIVVSVAFLQIKFRM
jgi:hypothetical protein